MRFRSRHFAVIDRFGKSSPGRLVQNIPFSENLSSRRYLDNHFEPSANDEQVSIRRWRHMNVVETGQGYISDLLEFRNAINEYFGSGAGVKEIADQGATVERCR